MAGFVIDIEEQTEANNDFRRVIFTAPHSQLVLMALQSGEEIGLEVHENVDQFFRIEEGEGKVIIAGEETAVSDGSAIVVPAGTEHNVINTGSEPLKLYTVYSPPVHRDGVVHHTKAEAVSDTADHI